MKHLIFSWMKYTLKKTREERKFEESPSLETKWSGVTQIENEKNKKNVGQIACSKEQMEAP